MKVSKEQLERSRSIYYLFLDESGTDYFDPMKQYRSPKERYLTIAGMLIRGDVYWGAFDVEMDRIKKDALGNSEHILHYSSLFFTKGNRVVPLDVADKLYERFLSLVSETDCQLISMTIDKLAMQERYQELWPPYHLLIAWHMERIVYALTSIEQSIKATGKFTPILRGRPVIEARSAPKHRESEKSPDRKLSMFYQNVLRNGSKFFGTTITAKEMQYRMSSGELRVRDKSDNINGLQAADLICFPLHWNTLLNLAPNEVATMIGERKKDERVELAWNVFQPRLAKSSKGEIEGYGIKLFPKEKQETPQGGFL